MAIAQIRSKRKSTGGRYKGRPTKKWNQLGSEPSFTKTEPTRKRVSRTLGNNRKHRLLSIDTANLLDPKTKTFKLVKIKQVIESPANTNYVRRNILTKGSIIETEAGKARVTSRPGQEAAVNAVLI